MQQRHLLSAALLTLPLLSAVGCDTPAQEGATKETAPTAKTAMDEVADGKVGSTADKGATKPAMDKAAEAPSCGDAKTIPNIPSTESAPPSVAEWEKGCAVNTQGANSQAKDCTLKVLREWAKITCTGKVLGHEKMEDFGQEGQNHYKLFKEGEMGSFVVRLRKGHSQKVRLCREQDRASLFVSWPGSKEQPTIIALALGAKCDGSEWGSAAKKANRK